MNRLTLFTVLLFLSPAIFSQSAATPPASSQTAHKQSQQPFAFSYDQSGQAAAQPWFKTFSCHGSNATQHQASAPTDFDWPLSAPCVDLKSQVELFALNGKPSSRSPLVLRSHPKGEPIPNQWPNLKVEKIPTQWPNLKLQAIDGGSTGPVPAHGSQK